MAKAWWEVTLLYERAGSEDIEARDESLFDLGAYRQRRTAWHIRLETIDAITGMYKGSGYYKVLEPVPDHDGNFTFTILERETNAHLTVHRYTLMVTRVADEAAVRSE